MRETVVFDDFSGGFVNGVHPRLLKNNELSDACNIRVSLDGYIQIMGGLTSYETDISTHVTYAKVIQPGYGLFTFSMDRSSTGGYQDTDYIVIGGKSTNNSYKYIHLLESDGTPWASTGGNAYVQLTTSIDTSVFEPVFYYIDGGLRMSDAHLINESHPLSSYVTRKWVGYIGRSLVDSTNRITYNKIYAEDADLVAPDTTLVDGGSSLSWPHSSSGAPLLLTEGQVVIQFIPGTSDVGFPALDQIQVYGSWVYDEKQEGPITVIGDTESITSDTQNAFKVKAWVYPPVSSRRITGLKVYYKLTDGAGNLVDEDAPKYLAEVDFRSDKGIRWADDRDWNSWADFSTYSTGGGSGVSTAEVAFERESSPLSGTYETETGIPWYTTSFSMKYKTVTINNRIAYIGNVRHGTETFNDSIFKSKPNRFDTFIKDDRMDIAVNDGESVVRLENYADRILEFKERTLYILNTAQDIEFLESKHDLHGVEHPYWVIRTKYGIAWFNKYGCYLYDGNRILDLLLDRNDPKRRKIDLDYWQSFLGNSPSIGYDATADVLIISADSSFTSKNVDIMLFDIVKGAWFPGQDIIGSTVTTRQSNWITDWNGNADVFLSNTDKRLFQWEVTATGNTTYISIQTKSISLNVPGIRKNLYTVYVTSVDSAGKPIAYLRNESTVTYLLDNQTNSTVGSELGEQESHWLTEEFIPSSSSNSRGYYSYMIRIRSGSSSSVAPTMKISDIQVILRRKGLR